MEQSCPPAYTAPPPFHYDRERCSSYLKHSLWALWLQPLSLHCNTGCTGQKERTEPRENHASSSSLQEASLFWVQQEERGSRGQPPPPALRLRSGLPRPKPSSSPSSHLRLAGGAGCSSGHPRAASGRCRGAGAGPRAGRCCGPAGPPRCRCGW